MQRTAANPYMPQGNPYMPDAGGGGNSVPNPDEMLDGPANPPIQPPPSTTTTPQTSPPRTMPGGTPAEMSVPMPGDSAQTPKRGTAMLVPIVCYACGQRGEAPLDAIVAAGACACGSEDIDLDSKEASWESDVPMSTLHEVTVVQQQARCSNCLAETMVAVTDPAQPLPPCPKCGADLLSAAGATDTRAVAAKEGGYTEDHTHTYDTPNRICKNCGGLITPFDLGWFHLNGDVVSCPNGTGIAEPGEDPATPMDKVSALPGDGGLGGHGLWATLVNAINSARSNNDKIPPWFMKYFKRLLLPEEIASGYFVTSTGGAYGWGTMGAKEQEVVATAKKVATIATGIRETNPSMSASEVLRLAHQTVERYPNIVGRRG